jgi:hypothetical protein
MSALPQPDPLAESDRLDLAADQAITACDGDMRSAIRALIIANEYLEYRNRELSQYISVGFVRGQISADNKFEDSLKDDLE